MKKIAIAVLLSAVVVPAAAVADEMHMYAGARLGQAKTSIDNTNLDTSNPIAFGVFIGHTFSPNFALEGEYLVLGEVKGSGGGSAKSTGFSLSGVGSFPINEQFSLFGKLGYAMITSKISDTGFSADAKSNAVTYGLGAQFNVSPAAGVRLGWDQYKLDDSSQSFKGHVNLISIGALFRF